MQQEKPDIADIGPVLTEKRKDYVAKRLVHLIDECAGYGGDPAERTHAAADAARALIELDAG